MSKKKKKDKGGKTAPPLTAAEQKNEKKPNPNTPSEDVIEAYTAYEDYAADIAECPDKADEEQTEEDKKTDPSEKQYVYNPKGRKRHIRRRITRIGRALRTLFAAGASVLLIYLALVYGCGFTNSGVEVTYSNGKTVTVHYLGFMKDGVATKGSVSYSDGRTAIIENRRVTYNDGSVYEGTLDGFIRSGIGTLRFANGDTFTGVFENDEICGQGKFVYYATGDIYEGIIINGKKEDHGTYTYFDTNVYKGEYENDLPHGEGKLFFYDGSVYEGSFDRGTRQGKGKYIFPSGDVYEGDFVNGKPSGVGVYRFACGDVYEGEFSDGKINGRGKYTWAGGRDYTGTFKDGVAVYDRD